MITNLPCQLFIVKISFCRSVDEDDCGEVKGGFETTIKPKVEKETIQAR
jgi:hypothetical protein